LHKNNIAEVIAQASRLKKSPYIWIMANEPWLFIPLTGKKIEKGFATIPFFLNNYAQLP